MPIISYILIISIILNFIFIAFFAVLLIRKGAIKILLNYFRPAPTNENKENPLYSRFKQSYSNLPIKENAYVFAGDSITYFFAWEEFVVPMVLNRGIGGDTVEGLKLRADELVRHKPQKLFIMIGINDLLNGRSSKEIINGYFELIAEFQKSVSDTQIFVQSILPINESLWKINESINTKQSPLEIKNDIQIINNELKKAADDKKFIFIDYYPHLVTGDNTLDEKYALDGIHLNRSGYTKLLEIIRPYIYSENNNSI